MLAELWKRRHIWSRGSASMGITGPGLAESAGALRDGAGTRKNPRALMAAHEYVVVFPGGTRDGKVEPGETVAMIRSATPIEIGGCHEIASTCSLLPTGIRGSSATTQLRTID